MAAKKKEQNTPDKALYLNENGERLSVEECFREIEGRIGALEDEELARRLMDAKRQMAESVREKDRKLQEELA